MLTMEWLKDFAAPAAQTLIWAGMIYLLGTKAISKFEEGINRTLDRLRKAGPAEFEPVSPSKQLDTNIDPTTAAPAALQAAAPESLPALFEQRIRESLEPIDVRNREDHLVRSVAALQIAWIFEALNFLIFGSQIALLHALNTASLSMDQARPFYENAKASNPEFYASYQFQAWLDWLISTGKFVERIEPDRLAITEEGREFLKYLIARGYSLLRFG